MKNRILVALVALLATAGLVAGTVPAHAATQAGGLLVAAAPIDPERAAALANTTFEPGSKMVDPDGKIVPVGNPTGKGWGNALPPRLPEALAAKSICASACYKYAGSVTTPGVTRYGLGGQLSIEHPAMDYYDWPNGGHTLAEWGAQQTSTGNAVEVGWRISIGQGDGYERLFTYEWRNGVPIGYNADGGFVDNGAVAFNAGDRVDAWRGTTQQMNIKFKSAAQSVTPGWWVGFRGQWIGVHPLTNFGGAFVGGDKFSAFGEVAAFHDPSCTDMGRGTFPTASGTYPTAGAQFLGTTLYDVNGADIGPVTFDLYNTAYQNLFTNVHPTGVGNAVRYGGPGSTSC